MLLLLVLLLVLRLLSGTTPYTSVGQRNETIVKGTEIFISTVYLLHELDEGTALLKANRLSAANGVLSTADGESVMSGTAVRVG